MATRRDVVLAAVGGIIVGAGAVLLSDMRSNKKKKRFRTSGRGWLHDLATAEPGLDARNEAIFAFQRRV